MRRASGSCTKSWRGTPAKVLTSETSKLSEWEGVIVRDLWGFGSCLSSVSSRALLRWSRGAVEALWEDVRGLVGRPVATGRTVGEGDELVDEASDSEAESRGSRVRMRNSFSCSSREDWVTEIR